MQRQIEQLPLRRGAHATRADGMCAMEMVAWLAGEPHSDEPRCVCPVIGALVRACNDVLEDEARTRYLRPLVTLLVDTRAPVTVERARGFLALDALVRRLVPTVLRRHRRASEAEVFAALGPVTDAAQLERAGSALELGGPLLRAARWVVDRAVEGLPPERYVAGLVQFVRQCGDPRAWGEVVELIERMAASGRGGRRVTAAG